MSSCEVCGSRDLRPLYNVTDTNEGVVGRWQIVQCQECGLGILNPLPREEEIAGFYQSVFYDETGSRFRQGIEFFRHIMSYFRTWPLRAVQTIPGRLLDFGSGTGHFAEAMDNAGWDVTAIEPYNQSNENEILSSFSSHELKLKVSDNTFDAISLWHVLEHLLSPSTYLDELSRTLKPGGYVLLSQPDFGSIQARFFQQHWLILDPPRHLYQFTLESLDRLMIPRGYERVSLTRRSMELGPFTLLQSFLNKFLGDKNRLFKYLKSPQLKRNRTSLRGVLDLLLMALLAVPALATYFILLLFDSGDVLTVIYKKKEV